MQRPILKCLREVYKMKKSFLAYYLSFDIYIGQIRNHLTPVL